MPSPQLSIRPLRGGEGAQDRHERTRGFHEHLGLRPLEENKLWGDRNPCRILVKHLLCLPRGEGP
jgi:hypothetical protein